MLFLLPPQFVEKEHALVNVHKESRLAIETEKKLKETLETKNTELSQKLQTVENDATQHKTKIQELETKVSFYFVLQNTESEKQWAWRENWIFYDISIVWKLQELK